MKKKLLIIGAIVVVVVIIVVNLTSDTSKSTKVQATVASATDLTEMVSASGRIQPQTKVDITSEVTGEIIDLRAKEGNSVMAGDLMIVLDTVRLRAEVDQARYALTETQARLEGAKASFDQAYEEYQRQDKLYKDKLTSETAYNNAKYTYLNARATHEAAQAQTKQLEARYAQQLDNLSKAKIVAPMSGIVTFVDCEAGEIAPAQTAFTQGKTLMTISNLSVFEVEVEVDETEINKVELNQSVDIEVDAFPDTVFAGEVVEIGNTAILAGVGTQDQSTNFSVKVIFKDPNVRIRPGMSATVDIITSERQDALAVPYSAIVMRAFDLDSLERARAAEQEQGSSGVVAEVQAADEPAAADTAADSADTAGSEEGEREEIKGVFVIRDGKARFVQVETGIADQKSIEVTAGVVDGDSVVSGPYRVLRTIKDGDNVEIIKKRGGEGD
ncbi:MAG: efflux RND transporter periplasmic adaptor subunit [Candidatus Zixiibacteriota bacterium]|nr:MAG: efflux RND transporter periplasmic adaptor subunit [candidate division Zixibacteria bacterium]